MKLLIDTNVILDVLLKREPFVGNAAKILQLIERQNVQEYVSTSAITDIYYIACRQLHDRLAVKKLLQQLCSLTGLILKIPYNMQWPTSKIWTELLHETPRIIKMQS